jgi:hypothetical protein
MFQLRYTIYIGTVGTQEGSVRKNDFTTEMALGVAVPGEG